MQTFKQLYNDNNQKRLYREDEKGNEYFYYQNKKENLVIRDYIESDISRWTNIVTQMYKLDTKQKKKYKEEFEKLINDQEESEFEYSLVVTTNAGKILGEIDVSPVGDPKECEVEVKITMVSKYLAEQYAESVVRAIWNLKSNYGWADKVYYRDSKERLLEMNF